MIRYVPLAQTGQVSLARFDHPGTVPHHDPHEEVAPDFTVNFVEQGAFRYSAGRASWRLGAGTVFVVAPGLVYRCRHEERFPSDVCFSLAFQRGLVEDVQRTAGVSKWPGLRVRQATNRLGYLKWLVERTPAAESMALETIACDLLRATLTEEERRTHVASTRQLAWYAERVRAVCERFERDYAQEHSLTSLGRAVGMSPYHFARIFRELTGTPPHRRLLEVRLQRAAQRLRDGCPVTDTCFAVGFSNLSHFIRLFRGRFGTSPSRYSRGAGIRA
ncbi:MAG TPA: AraC family transcriptional regulator [Terriglobales bacterium]|nr:AraC family transcriptional regulator [Terriglobales bacterium]